MGDYMEKCPGESMRYQNGKCINGHHRVCAQICTKDGKPLRFGDKDSFDYLEEKTRCHLVKAHKGDSWCLSWSHASKLVTGAGYSNVNIRCDATDIDAWLTGDKDAHVEGKEDEYQPILAC